MATKKSLPVSKTNKIKVKTASTLLLAGDTVSSLVFEDTCVPKLTRFNAIVTIFADIFFKKLFLQNYMLLMNRNLGSQLFLFRCDLVVSLFATSTIICTLFCSFNFRPNNMIFFILLDRFLTARMQYAQMKAIFWLSVTQMGLWTIFLCKWINSITVLKAKKHLLNFGSNHKKRSLWYYLVTPKKFKKRALWSLALPQH